jgi:hypothetical protein
MLIKEGTGQKIHEELETVSVAWGKAIVSNNADAIVYGQHIRARCSQRNNYVLLDEIAVRPRAG